MSTGPDGKPPHNDPIGGRLLLVDDDDADADAIVRLLEPSVEAGGLELVRARSLAEAIRLLPARQPTAILTDLTLPDATGPDIVRRLATNAPEAPVLAQCAAEDTRHRLGALEQGAQDCLVKGTITESALRRALTNALTRHHLHRQLTTTESRLDQAHRALDDVAAVFAHDLRAPVRTARLLAQAMFTLTEGEADDTLIQCRDRLDEALTRVDRLILAMVDYEALRTAPADLVPLAMAEVTQRGLEEQAGQLGQLDGRVAVDVPPDLLVLGDEGLLTRVVAELVHNALSFRRPELRPEISIRGHRAGPRVQLRVADNGKGIVPGRCERAFRPMDRLDPEVTSGLGMGLPMSRRIVESFGGLLEIIPKRGPGTEVLVDLPAFEPVSGSLPLG